MKRFIIFTMVLTLLVSSFLFTASAEETPDPIIVEYGNITVIFEGDTTLNEAQRMAVVQMIAGECSCEEDHQHICGECSCEEDHQHICGDDNTDNILCTLFGHKKVTETLVVVEHCVRDEAPRCRENYGTLTTCTRCDYSNFEVEFVNYIFCH